MDPSGCGVPSTSAATHLSTTATKKPEQGQLLPQFAREVLGEGHLACFFVDLRKALDFSPILGAYTRSVASRPGTRIRFGPHTFTPHR